MRRYVSTFGLSWIAIVAIACGARSTLVEPTEPVDTADGGSDARADARRDGGVRDAGPDTAVPPIGPPKRDASVPNDCADASTTFVYLISEESGLYSFYPPSLAIKKVGDIACPGAKSQPASMAVDRQGTAYSVFMDGTFWRLATSNAKCSPTSYVPRQRGLTHFGMGFVPNGLDDELFVSDTTSATQSEGLGRIDLSTMTLSWIGAYQPPLPRCELTGTADGRLFAFCLEPNGGSTLNEVDKTTAEVVASDRLLVGSRINGFAFAAWGGQFWIFTSSGGTTITEYDPITKIEKTVGKSAANIVGAGVSPCGAP